MTKKEYLDKRNELLAEADSLLNAGKTDECKAKQTDIVTLDNQFSDEMKELANIAALKDNQTITNLETKSVEIKEAKKVAEINEVKNNIIDADSPEYRVAFLKNLQGKKLTPIENEYTVSPNTAAGIVPTSTSAMIFDSMTKIAPMLNEIQLLRVPGNLRFAVQGVRTAAASHAEGVLITPDADTIVSVTLGGFEFTKVVRISATVQAMGIDAFEAWIVKIIAEELAVTIDNEIINSPTTTGGVIDGPAGGWVDGVSQITYVPGVGLTNANILAFMALLPSAYHFNAKFLMNNATFFTQVLGMEDANGEPLHKNAIAADGVKRIYGKEVLIDDNVAANEAYFGDFKKVVGNLSSDVRIDRSAESGFLNNSIDFRGTAIFDCDVADPAAIVKLNV